MISSIKGTVERIGRDYIDVDVRGIGYRVFTSLSTLERIGKRGEDVSLYTYLLVREDALSLFGFLTAEELDIFEKLITVSGVGPKVALGVLSAMTPSAFCSAVVSGDVEHLRRIPGIGPKTAQRIVLELKDKVFLVPEEEYAYDSVSENKREAAEALVALGFNAFQVKKALSDIDMDGDTAQLIKMGLKRLKS